MAYKIQNTDFFKKALPQEDVREDRSVQDGVLDDDGTAVSVERTVHTTQKETPVKVGTAVERLLEDSVKALTVAGFADAARELKRLRKSAEHERFTVAVVGEFSRGKSTFINKLLQRDILPVGDLPTTAVLTRIRSHTKDFLVAFDERNRKVLERELKEEAWESLKAKNFGGEDFKGSVFVGIRNKWLETCNIELMDTPGAGDLNDARARIVGDVLTGCDGAVIAISAIAPLSQSEKLFIEERLLGRRLPFLMLVVTKLDQIPVKERPGIIRYIKSKLEEWGMNIPVYIPYTVEMNVHTYDDIMGMDKVKNEIASWAQYPDRVKLVEKWMLEKTVDVLKNAAVALEEQRRLLQETDRKKQKEMADKKSRQLTQARLAWGELKLQMQKRCKECYELLLAKADEIAQSITEKLQYEAAHTGQPQKWWEEDFPYRARMEITGMAATVNNIVSRCAAEDARWYSGEIEKTFHTSVLYHSETIADKSIFGNFDIGGKMEFGNLDKQRSAFRIGTAVLSVSGVALLSSMGFMPIIATMGISTGSAVLSERFFKKKIEEQRDMLKKEIGRCIPDFIQKSMEESEKRVEAVYQSMIREADQSEQAWMDAQRAAIDSIDKLEEGQSERLSESLEKIKQQAKAIFMFLGGMENESIQ